MAIEDIIARGVAPPQVETLGDAWARMKAQQLAERQAKQQLTLGDLQTQEARIKLRQANRDDAADEAGRQLFGAPGTPQAMAAPAPAPTRPQVATPVATPAPQAQPGAQPAPQTAAASPQAQPQAQPQPGQPRPRPTQMQIFAAYGPVRGAAIVKAMTDADTAGVDLATKKSKLGTDLLDYEGNLAAMVKAADYSPDAVEQAMHMLEDHGFGAEAQQLRAHIAQDPTQVKTLMDQAIAASPKQQELASAATTAAARKTTADTGATKQTNEGPSQIAASNQAQVAALAPQLEAAFAAGGAPAVAAILDQQPHGVAKRFDGAAKPGAFNAAALTPDQAVTTAATAARDKNTATNEAAQRSQGQQRIGLEQDANNTRRVAADPFGALGLNKNPANAANANLHGTEFLATLPPAMATRVSAIASGRETLSAREKNSPAGQALQTAVEQFDPAWSEQRGQLRRAFTTGPDGRNIGNLNTAVVHLDQMHEAAKAMNNGTFQPGNQAWNYVAQKFGAAATTNYAAVMNALAGEAASALKGNATDPEIAHVMSTLSANMSPQQAEGIALTNLHTLGAKMNTYSERYHAQSPDDPWSPVLPSARAVFSRYGLDPTAPAAATSANPYRKGK